MKRAAQKNARGSKHDNVMSGARGRGAKSGARNDMVINDHVISSRSARGSKHEHDVNRSKRVAPGSRPRGARGTGQKTKAPKSESTKNRGTKIVPQVIQKEPLTDAGRRFGRYVLSDSAERRRSVFLQVLAETGKVTTAIARAGKTDTGLRTWFYDERARNDDFKKAWDEALEQSADALEAEATRRAVEGVTKPVYQGGERVGEVQEYSDLLLMFLLKGRRPGRFRENSSQTGTLVLRLDKTDQDL